MKFSEYTNQKVYNEALERLMFVVENEEYIMGLNESELTEGKLNDIAGKFGLKLHKGNGLIDYIKNFTVASGKLIFAAIKGDTEKVKEIAKGIKKEEVVDFLLKLDMATMHLVTGPIHFVDAITGWDLLANIKHVAHEGGKLVQATIQSVKDAVKYIKDKVEAGFAPGKHKKTILLHLDKVHTMSVPALS